METCARVKEITVGSVAHRGGVEVGDVITRVNGQRIRDILQYKFYSCEQLVVLEILSKDGNTKNIKLNNPDYEDLGITFTNPLIDKARFCSNRCIFCFIDQLPPNMRDTLYFKDDDSRLSFLQGNYVTLTNMTEDDINSIIKIRLSPINISVHSTIPDIRIKMLGNKKAGNILDIIKKLCQAGISVNCQIVLCRGINDQDSLDKTLEQLLYFYPHMNSISVVPVGITRYRERLFELEGYDRQSAREVIKQIDDIRSRSERHKAVYLADEFYILANQPIPPYSYYEQFPQIENGVGLIADMKQQFECELNHLPPRADRRVSIATGKAAEGFIGELCRTLTSRVTGLGVRVYCVDNNFFGNSVTVSGLLTGQDIITQLKGKELGDELLISSSMLRSGTDTLLDDVTVGQIEKELGVRVTAVENYQFINKVLGCGYGR